MDGSELGSIINTTNNFVCPFVDTNSSRNLKVFAIFFVGGFGILNNVFIVILALKYTTTKNLHHLIINMSVADSVTILSIFGLKVPFLLNRFIWYEIKITSGDAICKFLAFAEYFSMIVSYISLLMLSIERFRASRRTMLLLQPYNLKQRIATVCCSWLISVAFTALQTPYRGIEKFFTGTYTCDVYYKVPIGLAVFVFTATSIAFNAIIILSIVTLRRLSRRQEIEVHLSEVQRKARAKRISAAIKMVLSSLFLYSFCYIPIYFKDFFKQFAKGINGIDLPWYCYDLYIFDFLEAILPLVNSCCGPFIYLIFLSDFRDAAKKVIRCRTVNNAVSP